MAFSSESNSDSLCHFALCRIETRSASMIVSGVSQSLPARSTAVLSRAQRLSSDKIAITRGILESFVGSDYLSRHRMILVVCGRWRMLPFPLCDMSKYALESRTVRLVRVSSKTRQILLMAYETVIKYVNAENGSPARR
jgi:hypothetical protein